MSELNYLKNLESESIYILREVAAQFENPVLLYSIGKDSSVILELARKAFAPGKIPFSLLHIDTSYKFKEMYEFRDNISTLYDVNIIVKRNEEAIAKGMNPFEYGREKCCQELKTNALLNALKEGGYDAAIGGARRDEEKSRAKERIFSFRNEFGSWDPKKQRPELWSIFNGRINKGESVRVFPISNWTEKDVWKYIEVEEIPVVPLYFAKEREVIDENGTLMPIEAGLDQKLDGDRKKVMSRFRSLGCVHCTSVFESSSSNLSEIQSELVNINTSERSTRVIDYTSKGAMEKKKRDGYF